MLGDSAVEPPPFKINAPFQAEVFSLKLHFFFIVKVIRITLIKKGTNYLITIK